MTLRCVSPVLEVLPGPVSELARGLVAVALGWGSGWAVALVGLADPAAVPAQVGSLAGQARACCDVSPQHP